MIHAIGRKKRGDVWHAALFEEFWPRSERGWRSMCRRYVFEPTEGGDEIRFDAPEGGIGCGFCAVIIGRQRSREDELLAPLGMVVAA